MRCLQEIALESEVGVARLLIRQDDGRINLAYRLSTFDGGSLYNYNVDVNYDPEDLSEVELIVSLGSVPPGQDVVVRDADKPVERYSPGMNQSTIYRLRREGVKVVKGEGNPSELLPAIDAIVGAREEVKAKFTGEIDLNYRELQDTLNTAFRAYRGESGPSRLALTLLIGGD